VIRRRQPLFAGVADATLFRRLATVGAALVLVLLSCGREPTAPQTRDIAPRFARGFSFSTVFPQLAGSSAFADLVDFNRVRIQLHRVDGSVALDTTVTFPPGAESLTLSFDIRLAPGTPATGEVLSLDLAYLNAAGAVVFTGGPISIVAAPSVAGAPPPKPVTVPVVYTGPGSTARTVQISPRTLSVNTGAPFAFSAVGLDAAGATVANTPIVYTVLDPARATLASSTAGAGTALGVRGTARVVAQLINGAADTATLTINPVASAIAAVSGTGQTGIVGKPTPRTLAQPLVVRVTAADGLGVAGVPVTFAAADGGSVTPATATTDANGNAQTSWTLGLTALSQTASASAAGLAGSPVAFSATGTVLPATRLSLLGGPAAGSSIAAGTGIGLVVTAQDTDGDLVSSFTGTVDVALSANPSGGTLAGASSVSAVAGVASFTALNIMKPGTGYALQATSGSLTPVATPSFNIVPGAAASLVLLGGGGQTGAAGSTLAPVTALVTDVNGNAKAGVTVTFGVASGGGSVTPTTAVTDVAGHAVAAWTLGSLLGAQTLGISSSGVPSLTVSATALGALQAWVITQQPSASQVAGSMIAPAVVAELHDADNGRVTGFNGSATVAIGTNSGSATLGGTATVTAVNGVATFSGLTVNKAGVGYTLAVNSTGAGAGTTTPFSVIAGAASVLSIASGNAQSGAVSTALSQPVLALVTDANGNPKAGVAVTFAVTAGGGSVSAPTSTTDAAGHASTTWTLGTLVGTQTLSVASAGLTTVAATATGTSTGLTWVFTSQPSASQTAGVALTPAFIAELHTASGAVVTTFNGTATLALGANPGAVVVSPVNVTAVNGVATFPSLSMSKVGAGYTAVVSSTGTTSGTTNPFNVIAAAAATLSLQSGGAQSGVYGTALTSPIVALVVDAFQNPVAGTTVTFAVAAGGGSIATPTATTNASGLASTTWTLGASGAQALTVTAAGLAGSPLTVGANTGTGTITQTVVSPQRDTSTALGLSRQFTAQARDAANTNVAGTFTWVSRAPSIVTVSSTGLATSVSNGSAYIVATETGGTRDSALIVVQQRVATVSVTPGSRTLYAGAGFTFTAQAVDGNNRPMATQPAFTWSSTVPSAATVNASTGVVAAVAIGSTQIRATSGTFVGVSNLTVITLITRIDVSRDSAGAVAPDVFSLAALGFGRAYRAIAYDTAGIAMTGVSFTWLSTNNSVALLDTIQATRAHAIAAANGATAIQASAQGVTGAATLNVAQVLTAIDLQPTTLIVALGGTSSLLARGRDANGRFIAGGSFSYSSSAPAVATVGLTSGLVTGMANNASANITATSGAITSNTAVVQVNNSGAAIISFGRDTIGVGRGSSLSVPILLSKPSTSAVTVNLAVADTFAFWSPVTVTIPIGSNSVNATLNGRNAGTTHITAVDGSSTGYTGATSVVNVQANMHIANGATLNLGDQYSTQVILSDPSPPGGTYVTFAYGTPGIVSVSPAPAFIPAGQLAANLVISGIAIGNSTITPVATGVTGTAVSVFVLAPQLKLAYRSIMLGAGQFDPNPYVQVPTYPSNALVVSLSSSDSMVASAPPSVTIGVNQYAASFPVAARNAGRASIFANAGGWVPDTLFVTSTTPRVRVSGGTTLNVTSLATNVSTYATDSNYATHPRTNSLAVRVSSSDTTVIRVLDTLITIPAGAIYAPTHARVIPGGAPGSAYIRVTASGHFADSTSFAVTGPALYFSWSNNRVGVGQEDANNYVQIPNAIATPLTITIGNSDSTFAATAQTITMPAGQIYQYVTVRGKSTGTSTLTASAAGYASVSASTTVTTPRVSLNGGYAIPVYSTTSTQGYVGDSIPGSTHNRTTPLAVTFRSSNPSVMTVDSLEMIQPGTYYTQPQAKLTTLTVGTAWIIASAPGHRPDSVQWTVQPAPLRFNTRNYRIGARQASGPSTLYAYIPAGRPVIVPVTFTTRTGRVQLSVSVDTILATQTVRYFALNALSAGLDTIVATATGYLPDTAFVLVTSPKLVSNGIPGTANTTAPPGTTYVSALDSLGSYHFTADTVTIHAVSSNPSVLQPDSVYFHIPKGQQNASTGIIYVGVGTANITYSDSIGGYAPTTTNLVTVSGPALNIAGGNGILGMRQQTQNGQYYVSAPNNVGTPLVVNLLSTGTRVATVPATVTIPANSNFAYFTITARDTVGTIQIQATATGYTATSTNMQVTPPKFVVSFSTPLYTTAPPSAFYVYAADANGNHHAAAENVTVTLTSLALNVATTDSATVTIPSGQDHSNLVHWIPGAMGTATLTATDARAVYYQYGSATGNVTVQTPTASLSFNVLNLGVGQYTDQNVSLPESRITSALNVPLTHAAVPSTSTPSSVTIPLYGYFQAFRLSGTSIGIDTITAAPAGHIPATGTVNVNLGRLDPIVGWPASLAVGDSVLVTMYSRDPAQGPRFVTAATIFALSSSANIRFVSATTSNSITSVVIPQDLNYVQFYVKALSSGVGSASITNANYTTYTNSLSVP